MEKNQLESNALQCAQNMEQMSVDKTRIEAHVVSERGVLKQLNHSTYCASWAGYVNVFFYGTDGRMPAFLGGVLFVFPTIYFCIFVCLELNHRC